MYLRRVTFRVNNEEITITVDDEEDARKALREQLGVGRLPAGVASVGVKDVPLDELTKKELRQFIKIETARHKRISLSTERFPDMGHGWVLTRDNIKANLDKAVELAGA